MPLVSAGGGERRARCRLPALTAVPWSRGTGSWGVAAGGAPLTARVELWERSGTGRGCSGVRRRRAPAGRAGTSAAGGAEGNLAVGGGTAPGDRWR